MLKERLEDAGFIDVVVSSFKQPYGPWQKDERLKMVGAMVMMMADEPMSLLEAYGMVLLTRVLGKDVKEATKICDDGVKDIKNRNHHMYNFL